MRPWNGYQYVVVIHVPVIYQVPLLNLHASLLSLHLLGGRTILITKGLSKEINKESHSTLKAFVRYEDLSQNITFPCSLCLHRCHFFELALPHCPIQIGLYSFLFYFSQCHLHTDIAVCFVHFTLSLLPHRRKVGVLVMVTLAMIKHHDQGKLKKEAFNLGLTIQKVRVYDSHARGDSRGAGSRTVADILRHSQDNDRHWK